MRVDDGKIVDPTTAVGTVRFFDKYGSNSAYVETDGELSRVVSIGQEDGGAGQGYCVNCVKLPPEAARELAELILRAAALAEMEEGLLK